MLDDELYVTANARVQQGLTPENIRWAFTTTEAANWHPLTWLSHMLDVQLFGLDAGKHHFASLLLHLLNVVLLFILLFRWTGALWRSAFVAALFALHPLHVESVAWIAERKDVLSTLFWLLTLGAWLEYVRSKKPALYALALFLFALGLMAKPMLVTLPFTLLLLDFWPLRRLAPPSGAGRESFKTLLLEKAPMFVMAAASSVVTLFAQRAGGAVQTLTQLPFAQRAMNAAQAYLAYLGKALWPAALAIFYPHPREGLSAVFTALSFLAILCLTVLAFRLRRKAPYLLFGWLWYLGTLVPVIGLIQVGEQALADRYTYVPLLGIFIAAVWGLADLSRSNRALRFSMVALSAASLALLGVLTDAQASFWKDSETLFRHALAVTGPNSLAHNNYGLVMYDQGRTEEAIAHFKESIQIDPQYPDVHNNYGVALAKLEQWDPAIEEYETALQLQPGAPTALNNLGKAFFHVNRLQEAAACFQQVLDKAPGSADAHLGLGGVLEKLDRPSEALERYETSLRLKPRSALTLTGMGRVLGRMGRLPEAVDRLEEAVRIDPGCFEARLNLGVALDHLGRTPEAIELFRQALRIEPDSVAALDNLGLALCRTDRIPEAIELFRKAVRLAPDSADVRCHLGIALVRAAQSEEALEQFREALRISPEHALARGAMENILKTRRGGR